MSIKPIKKNQESELLQEQIIKLQKQLESFKHSNDHFLKNKLFLHYDIKEPEKVVVDCETKLPVLVEIDKKKIQKGKESDPTHLIIEGDNYHALSVLNYTHTGKIDLIYIDPPYNTGNKDFIYNDRFVDREDSFRHSKWLSFMAHRLRLAKNLLAETGVIFISIDDNEQAHLRLLCDQIFGEENFVNMVSVKSKEGAGASGGGEDKKLKKNIEYLLIYARLMDYAPTFNTVYKKTEVSELIQQYKDNDISWKYTAVITKRGNKEYIGSTVDGDGNAIDIFKRNNTEFKSVQRIAKDEGITEQAVYLKYFNDIFVTAMPQSSIRPRVYEYIGQENLDKSSVYSIEYVPKSGRNKGKKYEQFYKGEKLRLFAWFSDVAEIEDGIVYKKDIEGTLWDGINLNNLSKEGDVVFDNGKKPVDLLTRIIKMYPSKSAAILDFFAGSGTTGHAVLELNKGDNGTRQFILCSTNDEKEPIVDKVLYPRIKKVIDGYGDTAGIPANLRYFQTDFVEKGKNNDQTRADLVARAVDMINVREATYEKIEVKKGYVLSQSATTFTAIIFDSFKLADIWKEIEKKNTGKLPVKLYIFSFSDDTSAFTDMIPKNTKLDWESMSIPEGILQVYQRLFKKKEK